MQRYPPKPPGSTYVRTGDYGRGWKPGFQRDGGDLVATVTNDDVDYASLVGSPDQTSQHASTGWPRIDEVAEGERLNVGATLQAEIGEALRGLIR